MHVLILMDNSWSDSETKSSYEHMYFVFEKNDEIYWFFCFSPNISQGVLNITVNFGNEMV